MTNPPPHDNAAHPVDHAHVADLETCLDLVNTVELTDGVPEDAIPTGTDVVRWLADRGLAHIDDLEADAQARPDAWLARVHATRASLREVWDAAVEERPPDPGAIEALNDVLGRAPHPMLRPALAGVAVGHRHDPADAIGETLARVVLPLVAAIEAGDTGRFRVCANEGCRWVFEDTSRGGRRRWCDMNTCGNRAKVRRFRSKRRVAAGAGEPEAAGD